METSDAREMLRKEGMESRGAEGGFIIGSNRADRQHPGGQQTHSRQKA